MFLYIKNGTSVGIIEVQKTSTVYDEKNKTVVVVSSGNHNN